MHTDDLWLAAVREKVAALHSRLDAAGLDMAPGPQPEPGPSGEAAEAEAQQASPAHEVLQAIDRLYWDGVRLAVGKAVETANRESFRFHGAGLDFVCFGYLGLDAQEHVRGMIESARSFASRPCPYTVVFLDGAFDEVYRKTLKVEELARLKKEREVILDRIENHPERITRLFESLIDLVVQTITDGAHRDRLHRTLTNWYAQLEKYLRMERQTKEGGLSSGADRRLYIDLKAKHEAALAESQEVLEGYASAEKILGAIAIMNEETEKFVSTDKEYAQTHRLYEKTSVEVGLVTPVQIRVALEEEVAFLQAMARMCAKWSKIPPQSIPLARRSLAEPSQLVETLERILEYDPGLFDNRLTKRRGVPSILVLPAAGNGKYDWKNNRFLIPSLFPRTILESLASAAINYRDDVDRQAGERQMLHSFSELKEIRGLRSNVKIQSRLMDEYVRWIVKETAGFQVMEKEIREWFESNIAPDKNDLKIPRGCRGLSVKENHEEFDRLDKEPDTADKYYRMGVLLSLKNRRDQIDQENALRLVERATEMKPDPEYFYGLGVLYKRTHKKQKASEAFRKYIQTAPQSWWSRKAQEHLIGF